MKRLSRNNRGLTLVEVLVTLLLASLLVVPLALVGRGALTSWQFGRQRNELLVEANFALTRMTEAVSRSRVLVLPLPDNPATADWSEAERDLLAVSMDPALDRDNDGFADADNDRDGRIDEDMPADTTNDGAPGILGVDDDHDGRIDESIGTAGDSNNDEDEAAGEDWINGVDDDGDGAVDEDAPAQNTTAGSVVAYDNDGDGAMNEDWLDVVLFYVNQSGTILYERMPDIDPADGTETTERVLAQAASVRLAVRRLPRHNGDRADLVEISLELSADDGQQVALSTQVRVGRWSP